jgi:GNAT superfamily N-acetyltransferase
VVFRRYQPSDYDQVAALWSRINRELAPAGMEELFEQYIVMTISDELVHLSEVFSEAKKNAFWVVDLKGEIVGCFGIESHGVIGTELRRMYLDQEFRGTGIGKRMLECAEKQARSLGFHKMLVSTAEIQRAADRFYRRSGFREVRMEVAQTMSTKQAGGGLTRFYFEKEL